MTFFNVSHNGAKNDETITFLRLETGGEWIFIFFGVENDSTEEFSKIQMKTQLEFFYEYLSVLIYQLLISIIPSVCCLDSLKRRTFSKRKFHKLSNDMQVDRRCTCDSVVIEV